MEDLEIAQEGYPGADSHDQISIMESGYLSTTDTDENTTDTQSIETPVVSANDQTGMTQLQDVFGSLPIESNRTNLVISTLESGYNSHHEDFENVTGQSQNPTLVENYRTTTAVTYPAQLSLENVMSSHVSGEQEDQRQENLLVPASISSESHEASVQRQPNIPEEPPPLDLSASISSESHEASVQRQQNIPEEPPPFDMLIPDIPDMTENNLFSQEFQAVQEASGTLNQESDNSDDFDVHYDERVAFLRTAHNYYIHSTNVYDSDIDLGMIHHLRRKGEIPWPKFCQSCFQSPVGVQNLPCGCICNCRLCGPLMRCCARCQGIIRRYINLN